MITEEARTFLLTLALAPFAIPLAVNVASLIADIVVGAIRALTVK